MTKKQGMSAHARKVVVIEILRRGTITSQRDLVEALKDEGVNVTQATASRDLEELGAVRIRNKSGEMIYALAADGQESSTTTNTVNRMVTSVLASENLIVIKTPPGGAQLLASSIDRASSRGQLRNCLGTIAGDDTVLAIAVSRSTAKTLLGDIEKLFKMKVGK
jgi:transcriptional regulator of arginine metabolism